MRTTTIGDLAEAITAQIRGLAPAETTQSARGWRPVDDIDAVQSGEIRTFYVDIPADTVRPFDGGIYSPAAIEHEATCFVYASYGNLKRRDHRRLSTGDGRQVWLAIDVLRDAVVSGIAGLITFEHQGWQREDDEQGRQWGAHVFYVRVLLSGIPGAS